jgi:hypothetical protein
VSSFTITAVRGDTIDLEVTATRNSTALDLTGADIRFTAKNSLRDADDDAVIAKTLADGVAVVGDPEDGIALVTIDPADTSTLSRRTVLQCDVQVVEISGRVTTVAKGTLTIELDATRVIA